MYASTESGHLFAADGYIRRTSFAGLTTSSWSSWQRSTNTLRRPVTGLHSAHDPLSGEHYIVGSTEEGDVAVWDVRLQLNN